MIGGNWSSLWEHSCPWTWFHSPEGRGPGPTHQCTGTRPGTPSILKTETLGPSSICQWAGNSSKFPGPQSCPPARLLYPLGQPHLPMSGQEPQDNHRPAACRTLPASRVAPVLGSFDTVPPQQGNVSSEIHWTPHPATQNPAPLRHWANPSIRTPRTPQPSVSETSPIHQ